ncbi:MAG: GGDEF domain-containing protein [Proteobacteria bacterium]|nr:GGDEF domain-containing protein [Pseudomonadota bacterium]
MAPASGLPGVAGWLSRVAAIALLALGGAATANASCFQSANPQIAALDAMVTQDARKAIEEIELRLAALDRANSPDQALRAELYAVKADAYDELDLDGEAREAAQKGLKLATARTDPVHLRLLSVYFGNVFDEEGLKTGITTIDAARVFQQPGTPAATCLLVTLGRLRHYQNRDDLAIVPLTQAYQSLAAGEPTPARIQAAIALNLVFLATRDFEQALAMNQEVIDWDLAHGAAQSLSTARFRRGEILTATHDYEGAFEEFTRARELSTVLHDEQGVAFADLRVCEAQIQLKQYGVARRHCQDAQRSFAAAGSTDLVKEARTLVAQIELAEGQPARALALLNGVLDHAGADTSQRKLPEVYRLRSMAQATLGNYPAAYADQSEFVRRYVQVNDADRNRAAATLRARFGADRAAEHNVTLQRELALLQERAERQKEQWRWAGFAAVGALLLLGLLVYILSLTARHRRQLYELACFDGLTGLPNRRRAAEIATEALARAATLPEPTTIALIDLDHFKAINDRCGHAAGDRVLKSFADIGRRCLPATFTLGRWGGEEFLLVMPDTALDAALAHVQTLREAALSIPLPPTALELRVSFSAGLATNDEMLKSLDEIIARADVALYEAKNRGRDLVRIADESYRMASTGVRRALRYR